MTPAEGGALGLIETVLEPRRLRRPPRHLLPARHGAGREPLCPHRQRPARNLVFAGHTDVVPPGERRNGPIRRLPARSSAARSIGRGAVDMKGAVACALAASLDHLAARGGKPKGSISFLITGDEESIAVNGTVKLLKWAAERGEAFDHCILGEPSNAATLGDTIKIGRRGSLNGTLVITGKQGHVAYPERAENPVRGLVTLMSALMDALARPRQRDGSTHRTSNSPRSTSATRRQSHSGRGARALQHPLQRSSQPGFAQDADRKLGRMRPPATVSAGTSTGSRRTRTRSWPSPVRSSISFPARSRT